MTKLTKIKPLIPVPKAVTYEIVPSAGVITADSNGNITTGTIVMRAFKRVGVERTELGLTLYPPSYKVQYSKDDDDWKDCQNLPNMTTNLTDHCVRASSLAGVKKTLGLRLVELIGGSWTTVYVSRPLQVVKNGSPGTPGKFYYFDGYFDDNKEYKSTADAAPYVAFEWSDNGTYRTDYYKLKAETNKSGNSFIVPRTAAAANVWELMVSDFKYMITEAFFSEFAKLGSAVFCGRFMMSQYGNNGNNISYQNFDQTQSIENNSWKPNMLLDLLNGEIWAAAGKTYFKKDGSGQLAGGSLTWDTNGNINIAGFRRNKMRHITQANFGQVMSINVSGDYVPVFEKIGSLVSIDYLPGDIILKLPSDATSIRQYNGEEFLVYNNSGYSFNITGPIVKSETSTTTASYPIPSKWFALFRACVRVIGEMENVCWIMRARGQFA